MKRIQSLTYGSFFALLWVNSVMAAVSIHIENPIDEDEPGEIQRFLISLIADSEKQDQVSIAEKELQDLERYESVQCNFKEAINNDELLECYLKRFPIVRNIRFEGVPLLILEKELKKRIPIKSNQIIDPTESQFSNLIQRAETSLKSYLERQGFFHAQVQTLIEPIPNAPAADILFRIEGGAFARVRHVKIENELPFNSDFITASFRKMCSNFRYAFEAAFQGTACYNREIENETIAELEEKLADMGYVEAHLSVAKQFIKEADNSLSQFVDLLISVRPGPKLLISLDFIDSQTLNLSPTAQFFRTLSGVEIFSRIFGFTGPGAKYPEDETILVRQLEEALTFKKSHIIDETQIQASIEVLQETLRARGYINASIEASRQSERGKWIKINFKILARDPIFISSIKIVGKQLLKYSDLTKERPFLIHPRGALSSGHYTNFALDHDTNLVRDFFRSNGYVDAKVSTAIEKGDNGGAELIYSIEQGPKKLISKYVFNFDDPDLTLAFLKENISCKDPVLTNQAQKTVLLCADSPFSKSNIENDRLRLIDLYQSHGYLATEVISSIEIFGDEVHVLFDFPLDKMVKARVAELLIDGNVATRRNVIMRELGKQAVKPGNDLLPLSLDSGLTQLRRYNVFSKLTLDYFPKDEKSNDYYLFLQISEKPTFYIDTTFAFNTDRLFDLGLIMNERNLFGGLLRLKSDLHFGLFIGRLSTFRNLLNWPRFFGIPMDIELNVPFLLYEIQPNPAPLQRHAQLESSIAFKWQFLDKLFPALEFQLRSDKWQIEKSQDSFSSHNFLNDPISSLTTLDGLTRVLKEPSSVRGVLKPSLSIISLDDLFDPKRGFKLTGSLELSGPYFGAEIPYEVLNFQSTGYLTLGPLTLAANFYVKRAIIPNPQLNWRILKYQSDFDTLGGIRGPRSYDQNTIGIYDVLRDNRKGDVILNDKGEKVLGYHPGNFTLQSALEIRFPIADKVLFGKLNGVVFADLGFIGICDTSFVCFDRVGQLNQQNQNRQLGASIGLGLRYVLPVGPVALDYGISPIHESAGLFGRESRLHLQFGYPF